MMSSKLLLLFMLLASCLLIEETFSKRGPKKHKHKHLQDTRTKRCADGHTAEQIKKQLALVPRTDNQGGYLIETYKSTEYLTTEKGNRTAGTHIYFMLDQKSPTFRYHLLASDDVWNFYKGDPVKMIELNNTVPGHTVETVLGDDILAGQNVAHAVQRNTWFAIDRIEGGLCGWSLLGARVSPGYEVEDRQNGKRAELLALFPEAREVIIRLTPTE